MCLCECVCVMSEGVLYTCLRMMLVHRFGDRILSVDGRDFQDTSQKDAAEVLKSCDQLSVTMDISRVCSKLKPHALVNFCQALLFWCPPLTFLLLSISGGEDPWEEGVWFLI